MSSNVFYRDTVYIRDCVHVHWVLYLIIDFDLKLKFNVLNVLVVLPFVDIEYMWKQHAGGVKYPYTNM